MNAITPNNEVAARPATQRAVIGHSIVGTNNLEAASAFYDKVFAVFGIGRVLVQPGRAIYYGHQVPEFGITMPLNGQTATIGNGTMIAFEARSRAQVNEIHAAALAAGGSDEGNPGPRGDNGPYCAYFRDPEGNKFLVFRHGPDAA